MAIIDTIGKWNTKLNCWITNPSIELRGRSLSIANYSPIINDENKKSKIDYIVLGIGTRVENHTKDSTKIDEKKDRFNSLLEHYKNRNGNYCIKLLLMDADAPIIEDAKAFANYIDKLALLPSTNTINIVGLSKNGTLNMYIPSFFKNIESFNKTNIYNIAAPYTGTKLASPLIFYPEIYEFTKKKLGDNVLAKLVAKSAVDVYEGISSNSHMDYDIAVPNGIPESKKDNYDETFIKNIFRSENIVAIKRLNSFKNITTGIDEKTFREAVRTANFNGIKLCLLNDAFFDKKSDGMVYTDTQRKVEEILQIKSHKLVSSHHDVITNLRVLKDIISIVDDTIDETTEKTKKISLIH